MKAYFKLKRRSDRHGCLYLFTDELPSIEDIATFLQPYCEYNDDLDWDNTEITWDWWELGGRYAGEILAKVSSIHRTEDCISYEVKEVGDIEVISNLFNKLKTKASYRHDPFSFGWAIEHDAFGYIMNREDGSIRVDGAKLQAITNLDELRCYAFMDKNVAFCHDKHRENFNDLFNEMLDKYYEKDGFLTVLDIHF